MCSLARGWWLIKNTTHELEEDHQTHPRLAGRGSEHQRGKHRQTVASARGGRRWTEPLSRLKRTTAAHQGADSKKRAPEVGASHVIFSSLPLAFVKLGSQHQQRASSIHVQECTARRQMRDLGGLGPPAARPAATT